MNCQKWMGDEARTQLQSLMGFLVKRKQTIKNDPVWETLSIIKAGLDTTAKI